MRDEIIRYIKKNRVSSTEVADALGKTGALENIKAVNQGHFRVGKVFWTYAFNESNWNVHKEIVDVEENDIVIVDVFDCKNRAILGDIVSKYILLYKGAAALVVRGNLRDAPRLIKENWPVWCEGYNPIGCVNRDNGVLSDKELGEYREKYNGAIGVCDDTGVVIIEKDKQNQEMLDKLEFIEEQEDIWYECIDRKKWSTFETICLKKYRSEE